MKIHTLNDFESLSLKIEEFEYEYIANVQYKVILYGLFFHQPPHCEGRAVCSCTRFLENCQLSRLQIISFVLKPFWYNFIFISQRNMKHSKAKTEFPEIEGKDQSSRCLCLWLDERNGFLLACLLNNLLIWRWHLTADLETWWPQNIIIFCKSIQLFEWKIWSIVFLYIYFSSITRRLSIN